jgi:hypothetical protein
MFGKMDDAEALQEAEGGDGGIEIETRGKTGAEDQAKCFERIHGLVIPDERAKDACRAAK